MPAMRGTLNLKVNNFVRNGLLRYEFITTINETVYTECDLDERRTDR